MAGPERQSPNCFVELQSLFTDELPGIHAAIAAALGKAAIPYCGHWGQWPMNTPAVAKAWWGARRDFGVEGARADLLPSRQSP